MGRFGDKRINPPFFDFPLHCALQPLYAPDRIKPFFHFFCNIRKLLIGELFHMVAKLFKRLFPVFGTRRLPALAHGFKFVKFVIGNTVARLA